MKKDTPLQTEFQYPRWGWRVKSRRCSKLLWQAVGPRWAGWQFCEPYRRHRISCEVFPSSRGFKLHQNAPTQRHNLILPQVPEQNVPLKNHQDYEKRGRHAFAGRRSAKERHARRKQRQAPWSPQHNRTPLFNFLLHFPRRFYLVQGRCEALRRERALLAVGERQWESMQHLAQIAPWSPKQEN